jgi:hypothetical protein
MFNDASTAALVPRKETGWTDVSLGQSARTVAMWQFQSTSRHSIRCFPDKATRTATAQWISPHFTLSYQWPWQRLGAAMRPGGLYSSHCAVGQNAVDRLLNETPDRGTEIAGLQWRQDQTVGPRIKIFVSLWNALSRKLSFTKSSPDVCKYSVPSKT